MKKTSILFIAFFSLLVSCNKDKIHNTSDKVGISKVTYYANIVLSGNSVMSIVKGSPFTDPGAKATAAGKEIPITATGTVDNTKVGLYIINYSATNADGFTSSASRVVVVIPSPEVAGVDLSGSYAPIGGPASIGNATITKVAPAVYYTTNVWGGGSAAVIPAYFISTDGVSITIPLQGSAYGQLKTTAPGTYSSSGLITWSVILIDQGNLIRVKQWQKQ
jgi:hypothetical protein